MDKISVITTFYNAENFISKAVQSVLCQKTDNITIEYIIVDDHSPDHSLDIVNTLANNRNANIEIKIITPSENLGCGGARKFGIEHASGDYFMFLDADDYYINNDFISRAYECITLHNADIVEYGVMYNDNNNGSSVNMCTPNQLIFEDPDTAVYYIFKDNTIKFNVWSKIYTKEIVNSYPYSDTRTYEDIRTIPIWVHNAKKIVVMPTIEINYRAAPNSIIRENGLQTRLGTIKAMTEICERFKYSKKIVKALYNRAMIDLSCVLDNKTSVNEGFNEMSKLNTKLLSYIYPNKYKEMTFNIEDVIETDET